MFGYSVTNTGNFVILETKAPNLSLLHEHCYVHLECIWINRTYDKTACECSFREVFGRWQLLIYNIWLSIFTDVPQYCRSVQMQTCDDWDLRDYLISVTEFFSSGSERTALWPEFHTSIAFNTSWRSITGNLRSLWCNFYGVDCMWKLACNVVYYLVFHELVYEHTDKTCGDIPASLSEAGWLKSRHVCLILCDEFLTFTVRWNGLVE